MYTLVMAYEYDVSTVPAKNSDCFDACHDDATASHDRRQCKGGLPAYRREFVGTVKDQVAYDPIGFRFHNPDGNYLGEIVEFEGQLSLRFHSRAAGKVIYAPLAGVEVTGRSKVEQDFHGYAKVRARVIFAELRAGYTVIEEAASCNGWVF